MATRSRIGILERDGVTTKSIYCHWDGYPSGVGATLQNHYTDIEKIESLLELGDISVLAENVTPAPDQLHTFETPIEGVTIAYHRDRNDDYVPAQIWPLTYFKTDCEEWGYLYDMESGNWIVIKG